MIDDTQIHLAVDTGLFQLLHDQPRGERRGIERHAQIGGEIGHRADVVLVGMRQHHADQILAAFFDEIEIGENQLDPGVFVAAEGHAQIDHQPLAFAAIEIDVHANLARAAQRTEQQLVPRL